MKTNKNNQINVDKNELSNLLGVKKEALKKIIDRGNLEDRLNKEGYTLIKVNKVGKKNIYILEKQDNTEKKKLYNNICKYAFNTNKPDSFKEYFQYRTDSSSENKAMSQMDMSNISKVSRKTISKWDKTLIDKSIISKDGYFYFCIVTDNNGNSDLVQCTEDEYKSFWKNKSLIDSLKQLEHRYIKGEITLNELTLGATSIGMLTALTENRYYFRTKKYKVNQDNQLYLDVKTLIEDIY